MNRENSKTIMLQLIYYDLTINKIRDLLIYKIRNLKNVTTKENVKIDLIKMGVFIKSIDKLEMGNL